MSMSVESSSSLKTIEDRALMLGKVREFFLSQNVLEVDIPILSKYGCQDTHIELMQTDITPTERGYLHSSPEYGMKKLLCKIKRNIYQLCHVFRKGELGKYHRPEFSMIEWYLVDQDLNALIEQTIQLIQLFVPSDGFDTVSYEQVFEKSHGINPLDIKDQDLFSICNQNGFTTDKREDALCFLWDIAEKSLGKEKPCVVFDFPGSDSQLAKTTTKNNKLYALRFEVYLHGVELANGFDELIDPVEHRKRFEKVSSERQKLGKAHQSIDDSFLSLLEEGLPSCVGVAVGFDRLMMLRQNTGDIENILPLKWKET